MSSFSTGNARPMGPMMGGGGGAGGFAGSMFGLGFRPVRGMRPNPVQNVQPHAVPATVGTVEQQANKAQELNVQAGLGKTAYEQYLDHVNKSAFVGFSPTPVATPGPVSSGLLPPDASAAGAPAAAGAGGPPQDPSAGAGVAPSGPPPAPGGDPSQQQPMAAGDPNDPGPGQMIQVPSTQLPPTDPGMAQQLNSLLQDASNAEVISNPAQDSRYSRIVSACAKVAAECRDEDYAKGNEAIASLEKYTKRKPTKVAGIMDTIRGILQSAKPEEQAAGETLGAETARTGSSALKPGFAALLKRYGKPVVDYGVPLATGAGTAIGAYNKIVPNNPTPGQRIAGGAASLLMGAGTGLAVNPRAWRTAVNTGSQNAIEAAARTGRADPDYLSHFQNAMSKEILLPKAKFFGLSMVPAAVMQGQEVAQNMADTTKAFSNTAANSAAASDAVLPAVKSMSKIVPEIGARSLLVTDQANAAMGNVDVASRNVADATKNLSGNLSALNQMGELAGTVNKGLSWAGDKSRAAVNFADKNKFSLAGGAAGAAGLWALYHYLNSGKQAPPVGKKRNLSPRVALHHPGAYQLNWNDKEPEQPAQLQEEAKAAGLVDLARRMGLYRGTMPGQAQSRGTTQPAAPGMTPGGPVGQQAPQAKMSHDQLGAPSMGMEPQAAPMNPMNATPAQMPGAAASQPMQTPITAPQVPNVEQTKLPDNMGMKVSHVRAALAKLAAELGPALSAAEHLAPEGGTVGKVLHGITGGEEAAQAAGSLAGGLGRAGGGTGSIGEAISRTMAPVLRQGGNEGYMAEQAAKMKAMQAARQGLTAPAAAPPVTPPPVQPPQGGINWTMGGAPGVMAPPVQVQPPQGGINWTMGGAPGVMAPPVRPFGPPAPPPVQPFGPPAPPPPPGAWSTLWQGARTAGRHAGAMGAGGVTSYQMLDGNPNDSMATKAMKFAPGMVAGELIGTPRGQAFLNSKLGPAAADRVFNAGRGAFFGQGVGMAGDQALNDSGYQDMTGVQHHPDMSMAGGWGGGLLGAVTGGKPGRPNPVSQFNQGTMTSMIGQPFMGGPAFAAGEVKDISSAIAGRGPYQGQSLWSRMFSAENAPRRLGQIAGTAAAVPSAIAAAPQVGNILGGLGQRLQGQSSGQVQDTKDLWNLKDQADRAATSGYASDALDTAIATEMSGMKMPDGRPIGFDTTTSQFQPSQFSKDMNTVTAGMPTRWGSAALAFNPMNWAHAAQGVAGSVPGGRAMLNPLGAIGGAVAAVPGLLGMGGGGGAPSTPGTPGATTAPAGSPGLFGSLTHGLGGIEDAISGRWGRGMANGAAQRTQELTGMSPTEIGHTMKQVQSVMDSAKSGLMPMAQASGMMEHFADSILGMIPGVNIGSMSGLQKTIAMLGILGMLTGGVGAATGNGMMGGGMGIAGILGLLASTGMLQHMMGGGQQQPGAATQPATQPATRPAMTQPATQPATRPAMTQPAAA